MNPVPQTLLEQHVDSVARSGRAGPRSRAPPATCLAAARQDRDRKRQQAPAWRRPGFRSRPGTLRRLGSARMIGLALGGFALGSAAYLSGSVVLVLAGAAADGIGLVWLVAVSGTAIQRYSPARRFSATVRRGCKAGRTPPGPWS
jgi:hypothetical protein